jgi:phage-related minor tail protein
MIEKLKNNIEFVEEKLQDYDPEQSNEIKKKKLDEISSTLETIYSYIEGAMGGSDQELENIKIRYRNLDHEYKNLKKKLDNSPDDREKNYLG